jgi:hypothetical protein
MGKLTKRKLQAKIQNIMVPVNSWCIFILFLLVLGGCSSNYQLGDISKSFSTSYCHSTDLEFRNIIKAKLDHKGFNIGVGYCSMYGLVDARGGG